MAVEDQHPDQEREERREEVREAWPETPRQEQRGWYQNPRNWAIGGAGLAALVLALALGTRGCGKRNGEETYIVGPGRVVTLTPEVKRALKIMDNATVYFQEARAREREIIDNAYRSNTELEKLLNEHYKSGGDGDGCGKSGGGRADGRGDGGSTGQYGINQNIEQTVILGRFVGSDGKEYEVHIPRGAEDRCRVRGDAWGH
ncbi:MAG: hypothetical protein QXP53_01370 [Candidatus Pacearchaeota archaeon]